MKRSYRYLILLALALVTSNHMLAQKAAYTSNRGITLGFGAGASYQQSDIANSSGYGLDLWIGSNLYQKENAFIALDWKFRFLAGDNRAFDHRINIDNTYSNIRYSFFNYDLELGLTLNRLRERTRIILTGFAGFGITHGRTFSDLYDENNNLYDYSVIDPGMSRSQIKSDLVNLSDKDFETTLINRGAIMPTAGIYLGYQFSPSFSLGIEHKVNFSLNEENSTFSINIDNNIATGSSLDMNHYTSIGFRWTLGGRSSRTSSRNIYPEIAKSPVIHKDPIPVMPVTTKPPLTTTPIFINKPDTTTKLPATSRVLTTTRPLTTTKPPITTTTRPLTDTRRITSTKPVSTTRPVTVAPDKEELPEIRFINPVTPLTVENNLFSLKAQTKNIKAWQDVEVIVNGVSSSLFSFTPQGMVSLNFGLKEGPNNIKISGKNESGMVTEKTSITYTRPCLSPELRIIEPAQETTTTDNQTLVLKIELKNIRDRNQLTLVVNGEKNTTFSINGNELRYSASLIRGVNTFELQAKNDCGSKSVSSSINYDPPLIEEPPCYKPELDFNLTVVNSNYATHELKGFVKNARNQSDITLTVNGTQNDGFHYSPGTGELSSRFNFSPGSYLVKIEAKNECGSDSKVVSVRVEEPCFSPTVSFNISELNSSDASHKLVGSVSNIISKNDIKVSVNGTGNTSFSYSAATGELKANLKLSSGTNNIVVYVQNECGEDSKSVSVRVEEEEKPCGVRINPGNSQWQFCLVTPGGTYNRASLSNKEFSYTGTATSLFMKPIGGGGDAIVNGKPYTMKPGSYYLFKGNITVKVSSRNPGSMGQWSICITSNSKPVSGNGNNRPQSPCEQAADDKKSSKAGKK